MQSEKRFEPAMTVFMLVKTTPEWLGYTVERRNETSTASRRRRGSPDSRLRENNSRLAQLLRFQRLNVRPLPESHLKSEGLDAPGDAMQKTASSPSHRKRPGEIDPLPFSIMLR